MLNKANILEPLMQLLRSIAPIDETLERKLIDCFKLESIDKHNLLLKENSICNKLWFLADGVLKAYHTVNGKEVISRIMFTNHIVIAPGSFFMQTPSTESIETITDVTVATIYFNDLQQLYKDFPYFNYHTRRITEYYFYKQEQRLLMLRQLNPLDKYKYFFKNFENYINVIPQKDVASFLGITRETYNRIHKNEHYIKKRQKQ